MAVKVVSRLKKKINPEYAKKFANINLQKYGFIPLDKIDGYFYVITKKNSDINMVKIQVTSVIDNPIKVYEISEEDFFALYEIFKNEYLLEKENVRKLKPINLTKKKLLGEMLLEKKLITESQLTEALVESKQKEIPIGSLLVEKEYITLEQLKETLFEQQGIEVLSQEQLKISIDILKMLPDDFIIQNKIIPVSSDGKTLVVGMLNPDDKKVLNEVVYLTGQRPKPKLITYSEYSACIDTYYNSSKKETSNILKNIEEEASIEVEESLWDQVERELQDEIGNVAKFANKIITDAIDMGASDIHIEPRFRSYVVRYRIDGILKRVLDIPQKVESAVITRFKVLARMNIAEHRRSQDGTFTMKYKNVAYDFRLNTLPVALKEKMVIRVLAPAVSITSEDNTIKLVGASSEDLARIRRMTASPNGIIIASGPTGSGKTTSLYAILKSITTDKINITTIEDPVEIKIDGINQSQVNPKAGITFATCMRAILRQDPDVILVGEIRDYETLEVAISAALTGHLVLSTLHTNSAAATVTRLIEMGAKDYLVSSTLTGVIAQRLVRRLCPKCKEKRFATKEELELILNNEEEIEKVSKIQIYEAHGCKACEYQGYNGRLGVYEVLPITKEMKKLIAHGAHDIDIEESGIAQGMKTLHRSCLEHILNGDTTIEEFLRVLGPVNE